MATDLGPLTLKLTASAGEMAAGLSAAQAASKSWAASVASGMNAALGFIKDTFSRVSGWLEDLFKSPGKAIAGWLDWTGDLLAKIPVLGKLLAAPFWGLSSALDWVVSKYDEGTARIKELGKAALMAGMKPEDFVPFSMMVGDVGAAAVAGFKFSQTLGQARMAAEGTRTAFDKIGLRTAEINKMTRSEALAATMRQIARLAPELQAAAARQFFGRGGLALLPQFAKGPEQFAKMQKYADKFGLGFNEQAIANIATIEKASKQLGWLKQGFSNQLHLAVAPFLAELSEMLGEIPIGFGGLSSKIMDGLEGIARMVAFVADEWGNWDAIWAQLKVGWDLVYSYIEEGIGKLIWSFAEGMGTVVSKITGLDLQETIGRMGWEVWKDMTAAAEKRREAAQAAYDEMARWQEFDRVMAEYGFGEPTWGGKVSEAIDRIRAKVTGLGDDAKNVNLFGAFYDRAVEMEGRLESPLEAFKNGLHEIQMMQQAGLDIFSPDLAQLRGNELLQQLRSKLGMNYTPVGIATAGGKDAFSAAAQYKFNASENVAQELNRLTMEANRQRQLQVETGQKVLDAVKDAGIVRVKGIGG